MESKLRTLRKEKGMCQADIGQRIGVTQRMISLWELGKRELPVRHAKKIAGILNCDWKELY